MTDLDVAVSRSLHKIDDKADFVKAVGVDTVFIVAKHGGAPKIVGRSGKNVRQLERELGKKVRIIENSDTRSMTEAVLGVPVVGVNIVYNSGEKYRVRVSRVYRRRITEQALQALNSILDKPADVVFE